MVSGIMIEAARAGEAGKGSPLSPAKYRTFRTGRRRRRQVASVVKEPEGRQASRDRSDDPHKPIPLRRFSSLIH